MSNSILSGILMAAYVDTRVSPDDITGHKRAGPFVRARHAAIFALIVRAKWSYTKTAVHFGGRDHTSVLHGFQQAQKRIANDPDFARLVDILLKAPEVSELTYAAFMARLRNPETAQPEGRLILLKPVERKEPSPAKPVDPAWLKDVRPCRLKWFASIDDEGHCYGERFMAHDMRRGSNRLRAAILRARAA